MQFRGQAGKSAGKTSPVLFRKSVHPGAQSFYCPTSAVISRECLGQPSPEPHSTAHAWSSRPRSAPTPSPPTQRRTSRCCPWPWKSVTMECPSSGSFHVLSSLIAVTYPLPSSLGAQPPRILQSQSLEEFQRLLHFIYFFNVQGSKVGASEAR